MAALSMINKNSSCVKALMSLSNMECLTTGGPRSTAQGKVAALPSRSSCNDVNFSLETSLLVCEVSSASRRSMPFTSSDVFASWRCSIIKSFWRSRQCSRAVCLMDFIEVLLTQPPANSAAFLARAVEERPSSKHTSQSCFRVAWSGLPIFSPVHLR